MNLDLRIFFDDLHQAGIYTWSYLHDLGEHKLTYSRQYIRRLRERGLSRDPPPRKELRGGRNHGKSLERRGEDQDLTRGHEDSCRDTSCDHIHHK